MSHEFPDRRGRALRIDRLMCAETFLKGDTAGLYRRGNSDEPRVKSPDSSTGSQRRLKAELRGNRWVRDRSATTQETV